ncbi:MAG: phage BR0599 family protein [Gammaproteobacteria bacterium]|nr:phage BR0599 family protein [Gammaproteobacteria bacterium]
MAKNVLPAVSGEFDATSKRPRLLMEIDLVFPSTLNLRYVKASSNLTFPYGGTSYTAKTFGVSGLSQSIEGQIERITIDIDNVAQDMGAYADSYKFEGANLRLKRIYLNSSGQAPADSGEYVEIFGGECEAPTEISRKNFQLSAVEGSALQRNMIERYYLRTCGLRFGGSGECNMNQFSNLGHSGEDHPLIITGTAVGGDTDSLIATELTQPTNHWKHGRIKLTESGVTFEREINASLSGGGSGEITFDVALPVSVTASSTFEIKKGCDKTWNTCGGNNAWGPSGENTINFGGFLHVEKKEGEDIV